MLGRLTQCRGCFNTELNIPDDVPEFVSAMSGIRILMPDDPMIEMSQRELWAAAARRRRERERERIGMHSL